MNKNDKVGRSWIITYISHSKKINGKVVSVLKYQKSIFQIVQHITQLYVDSLYPLEKIAFLKNRDNKGLIDKPRTTIKNGEATITIGHDPYLFARQVKNLKVNNKQLAWDEL